MNENKREMLRYVGDFSQLFGIKEYILVDGKSKGVRAYDVKNGSGLEFTILADRCLDIAGLSFKGINCSYIAKAGIVAPEFYDEKGIGFLRSYLAGFLTTCGLRNVGSPCEENGEYFPLHGRMANTPAEQVNDSTEWIDDVPVLTISGQMREARLFGENLVLGRKIISKYGENKITLQNTIENLGFKREELNLLFHFNMGYPLLDADSILVTPTAGIPLRSGDLLQRSGGHPQSREKSRAAPGKRPEAGKAGHWPAPPAACGRSVRRHNRRSQFWKGLPGYAERSLRHLPLAGGKGLPARQSAGEGGQIVQEHLRTVSGYFWRSAQCI